MCFKSAPKPKPIPNAPTASPEVIDDTAKREQDRERQKRRLRYGRSSTILNEGAAGGAPATMPAKTALGA